MKALLVIGLVVALTPALRAQDGLRSASLPERPIATQPPGPEDLFRAGPETYRPRSGRKPPQSPQPHDGPRPVLSNGWSYWPYVTVPQPDPPATPRESRPAPETGVLQLRIAPEHALVYIDGLYDGTAATLRLTGTRLRAGVHRVRIEAPGYQPSTFDARIAGGETVTHSQVLDPVVSSSPAKPVVTNVARTMYVIPRCYAGDKPPDASSGCDLTKLRTIR
jgi:hypothetical protein